MTTDNYYNKEGKAFNAGLETLNKNELMSLVNFMKAHELVDGIQIPDPEFPLPRETSVTGYEVRLSFDRDQTDGWFRVIKDGDLKVETNDPEQAAESLAYWFDHDLGLRLLGIKG